MTVVGRVHQLWRYPVKSLMGERVSQVALAADGVVGDRAYAIFDVENRAIAGASNSRDFPTLLEHGARVVGPAAPGQPVVELTSPAGETVRSDAAGVHEVLSRWLGRAVRLISTPPPGYLESRASFLARIGRPDQGLRAPLQDAYPVSVITTATLATLAAAEPGAVFDVRRFRMNVVLDVPAAGFPENDWVGRGLALGADAALHVDVLDPRCVVTTLAGHGFPRDPRILRTVARVASQPVGPSGALPCAGVYAMVQRAGVVQPGDEVRILEGT